MLYPVSVYHTNTIILSCMLFIGKGLVEELEALIRGHLEIPLLNGGQTGGIVLMACATCVIILHPLLSAPTWLHSD